MGRLVDLKFLTKDDFRIVERVDTEGVSHFRVQKCILEEKSRFSSFLFYWFGDWNKMNIVWKDVYDKITVWELDRQYFVYPFGESKDGAENYIKAALEEDARIVNYAHRVATVKEIYHYL